VELNGKKVRCQYQENTENAYKFLLGSGFSALCSPDRLSDNFDEIKAICTEAMVYIQKIVLNPVPPVPPKTAKINLALGPHVAGQWAGREQELQSRIQNVFDLSAEDYLRSGFKLTVNRFESVAASAFPLFGTNPNNTASVFCCRRRQKLGRRLPNSIFGRGNGSVATILLEDYDYPGRNSSSVVARAQSNTYCSSQSQIAMHADQRFFHESMSSSDDYKASLALSRELGRILGLQYCTGCPNGQLMNPRHDYKTSFRLEKDDYIKLADAFRKAPFLA
jgi:hypothetical protein